MIKNEVRCVAKNHCNYSISPEICVHQKPNKPSRSIICGYVKRSPTFGGEVVTPLSHLSWLGSIRSFPPVGFWFPTSGVVWRSLPMNTQVIICWKMISLVQSCLVSNKTCFEISQRHGFFRTLSLVPQDIASPPVPNENGKCLQAHCWWSTRLLARNPNESQQHQLPVEVLHRIHVPDMTKNFAWQCKGSGKIPTDRYHIHI